MKNPDNIPDPDGDFRERIDGAEEQAQPRLANPRRATRLSLMSKVRLCVEILATNKTQAALAREHACTKQAVNYYATQIAPRRRRTQPVILFKQGELELLY